MTAQSDLQSKQQAQQGVFMRKKVMTLLLSLALVASFAACIDDVTTNNDAGQDAATIADAAGADSGQVEADAAIDDAAGSDAATNEDGAILTNDASMNDAGVEDGGLVLGDAGDDPDATTNDAGDEDSGTVEDGGFAEDGGVDEDSGFDTDAGAESDASIDPNDFYFGANDGLHGEELWKTDGSEAGTVLIKDINPGLGDGAGYLQCPMNGKLFFAAFDETHGFELWKTDGTEAGTRLVKDIKPGREGSMNEAGRWSHSTMICFLSSMTASTAASCGKVTAGPKTPSWSKKSIRGPATAKTVSPGN